MRVCGHSCDIYGGVGGCLYCCMMVADNKLGDEGMVALAPALSKLVALTSVSLNST